MTKDLPIQGGSRLGQRRHNSVATTQLDLINTLLGGCKGSNEVVHKLSVSMFLLGSYEGLM